MNATVGLAVLVKDTGESARTLQHWSDLGILRPLASTHKQGRGYHREFPAASPWYGERTWALFASELNRLRVPLGDIKLVIDSMRKDTTDVADQGTPAAGWQAHLDTHPIGRALSGRFVIIVIGIDERKEIRWAFLLDKAAVDRPDESLDPDATLRETLTLTVPWTFAAEFASGYMMTLSQVLAPLTGWVA